MTQDMRGAWYFARINGDGTLMAIEPDGTQHTVTRGDMSTAQGVALLNRMVVALATPREPKAEA